MNEPPKIRIYGSYQEMIKLHKTFVRMKYLYVKDYVFSPEHDAWNRSMFDIVICSTKLQNDKRLKALLIPYLI